MSRRSVVIVLAAIMLALLMLLTVIATIHIGISVLTVVSLAVIGFLAVGIAGAIFNQPKD